MFPAGTALVPLKYRKAMANIVDFASHAADIAQNGQTPSSARLQALSECRAELIRIEQGELILTKRYQLLAMVLHKYRVPIELCHELLTAFEQDVTQTRYADFGEVVQYCRHSAVPLGRILLHIYGAASPLNLARSDGIYTALQLTGFWANVAPHWQQGRIYIAQADLARFGVTEAQIAEGRIDTAWRRLMAFELDRTRRMLKGGAPLANTLPGRLGLQLRSTVLAADALLHKLQRADYDMFCQPLRLDAKDWPRLIWRALRKK